MSSGVFGSVRGKTLLYFSIVLSLCAVLIGGACCYFFSRNYNAVIERESAAKLTAISNQLDVNVFRYIKWQCMEFTADNSRYRYNSLLSFVNETYTQPPSTIWNAVGELQSLIYYSNGTIYSADMYYPENDMILSSVTGYLNLSSPPVRTERDLWEPVAEKWQGVYRWDVRKISSYYDEKTLCFWGIQNTLSGSLKALLALSINPLVFSRYLSDLETEDEKYFLINNELYPLYGSLDQLTGFISSGDLSGMVLRNNGDLALNTVHRGNPKNNNVSVSYIHLSEAPVVLISVISNKALYSGINGIITSVAAIVIFVLGAGLTASGFFSKKLYTPLKQLVVSINKLPLETENRSDYDEFILIKQTIENLSYKASEYEKTFSDYLKIMRYGFLQSLFNRQLRDKYEILTKARYLNLNVEAPFFKVMKVTLIPGESQPVSDDLPAYNILTYIESQSGQQGLSLYGIKNTGMSLSVLCNYHSDEETLFRNLKNDISRYCSGRFSIRTLISLSSARESLEDIYLCAEEIENIEPYFYLCPERSFLAFEDLPALDNPKDLPMSITSDFEAALKTGKTSEIQTVLVDFCGLCESLEYSIGNCTDHIKLLAEVLIEYKKTHKLENSMDTGILKAQSSGNIFTWREMLENACIRTFEVLESRSKNQKTLLVSNILAHINTSYASPLISLDSTANHFNISSSWAAKLIKEETGLSFVDYLNNRRLEVSERLLKDHSLKIEDVAEKSGFNSAAYFIKRFRIYSGMTPKEYRMLNPE